MTQQRSVFRLSFCFALAWFTFAVSPKPHTASWLAADETQSLERGLLAHWPLAGDTKDHSGQNRHAVPRGEINLRAAGPGGGANTAAEFNGKNAWLEVPRETTPKLGSQDFTAAVWLCLEEDPDDVPGDILTLYDQASRRGFHLSLKTNAVTSSLANHAHLHFGIDNDRVSEWEDCGRPGNAVLAFSLAVHEGALYAGTCEPGKDEAGRVYRYEGGKKWVDCGAPDGANAVTALAVHRGALYAGTGKYRLAGSALPESQNTTLGGRVFRFAGPDRWVDCGQLPETEAVGGICVFRGELYASSLYRPAGFYRYHGERGWTSAGTPGKRVNALGVYNGHLYASSYDGGRVYRFDGKTWADCGQLGENTQTYSFAVYRGALHVGTWPSGRVYRFEDVNRWQDLGRLGQELEVMGMLVHNGRLLAGTLPLAEVYSHEGEQTWKQLATLDRTPSVQYRRAWTMAEHEGRVYCSTLPSGKVFAFQAGRNATFGRSLTSAWRHVAAVKSQSRLALYVDGEQVAESSEFAAEQFSLDSPGTLKIGFGSNDYFHGRLSDLRLYGRPLAPQEVQRLAKQR